MDDSNFAQVALHNLAHSLRQTIRQITELQVWRATDQDGHPYWHAYNPHSGRSTCFGSESDIRAWIEQQHYEKPGF
jgi:hypothetical protein